MWFSDNNINPLGASGTTALHPLPVCGGWGGRECLSLGPLHLGQRDWGESHPFLSSRKRDTQLPGGPSSLLPFPLRVSPSLMELSVEIESRPGQEPSFTTSDS